MDEVVDALVRQRLPRRYREMKRRLQIPEETLQYDIATELSPANIMELGRAIDQARNPKTRAILMRELANLKALAASMAAPPVQEDVTGPVQKLPWNLNQKAPIQKRMLVVPFDPTPLEL